MPPALFDFTRPDAVSPWQPINDGVMGGVSEGQLHFDPAGYAVFQGSVSFEHNGGFASVRCLPREFGIAGAVALTLEANGDGKCYKLNLRTEDSFDGVNYQAKFHPPAGTWTSCRLRAADFSANWRGRPVLDAPPLDFARLRQLGLMIADRQGGPFRLAIRAITAEVL
jgi:NADH dehydrogenase [ubiquinone] 1 alpha subcomplex assembly factor 1